MGITHYVAQYGYAALIVDSLVEDETIILLGDAVVHQGVLKFPLVVLSATLGEMTGDQPPYLPGRRFDGKILHRFSRYQAKIHYAQKMI